MQGIKGTLSWLHLSDVHFSGQNSYDQNRLVSALLNSLPNLTLRFGAPDFVFFTGDIARTGCAREYQEAEKFFNQLLTALKLDRDRLLLVPGNHDVDRSFNSGLTRDLKTRREIDDLFNGQSVYQIEKRQRAFKYWYEDFFSGRIFPDDTTCYLIQNFEQAGFPIEVWGLNSAAFSFDDYDQGKLILSQRCVCEATESHNRGSALRVALTHHPLSWLSEVERTGVKAAVNDNFDLLLHGHLHENEVEIAHGSAGQSIVLASGAIYQGSEWPNVANFTHLSGSDLKVFPIRYHDSPREIWTADTSLFPDDVTPSFPPAGIRAGRLFCA
ncbi:metallophosphoesterase family protein [Erythrobacter litoralis]|uniref:metallophosphoesterase family protein n=1 Tax=Erythrobacter litoralis TaxID=39960 RepID=UPI000320DA7E|nr:metallophosphoesterase [Erythrobacter litoralis]